jgi:hypothetical protein
VLLNSTRLSRRALLATAGLSLGVLLAACGSSSVVYDGAKLTACLHANGARTIPFASFASAIDRETGSALETNFPDATAAVFTDNEFLLFATPAQVSSAKAEQAFLMTSWSLTPVTVTRSGNLVTVRLVSATTKFLQTVAGCESRAEKK